MGATEGRFVVKGATTVALVALLRAILGPRGHGKTMGKPWENLGKPWEKLGTSRKIQLLNGNSVWKIQLEMKIHRKIHLEIPYLNGSTMVKTCKNTSKNSVITRFLLVESPKYTKVLFPLEFEIADFTNEHGGI